MKQPFTSVAVELINVKRLVLKVNRLWLSYKLSKTPARGPSPNVSVLVSIITLRQISLEVQPAEQPVLQFCGIDGTDEGFLDGSVEGSREDVLDGSVEGPREGLLDSSVEGSLDGLLDGSVESSLDGFLDGSVRKMVVWTVGCSDDSVEGSQEGRRDGLLEGIELGVSESNDQPNVFSRNSSSSF